MKNNGMNNGRDKHKNFVDYSYDIFIRKAVESDD